MNIFVKNIGKEMEIDEGDNLFKILHLLPEDNYVGAIVNDTVVDFYYQPEEGDKIEFITHDSEKALDILNHSTSHILAWAVKSLFKGAKLGIGPSIKNGFYYDFLVEKPFTPEDIEKIENKMRELLTREYKFEKEEISKERAKELFKDEKFKLELIDELEEETISIYKVGEFVDLCRVPHLPSTKYIKHSKLLSASGAYW
ncbi:MAG: threonine--tRNA ligase, partial [Caldiserica bacterium]